MADRQVNIELSEDDRVTAALARALLVAELASQMLAIFVVLEMVEHGQLTYLIKWHWDRWRKRLSEERQRSRDYQRILSNVLFEAEQIVREQANG